MSEMKTVPTVDWFDRRVLFQYIDNEGHDRFEFTTVLSASDEHAAAAIAHMHQRDIGFEVVQVAASNGQGTGYTPEQLAAAVVEYKARGRVD